MINLFRKKSIKLNKYSTQTKFTIIMSIAIWFMTMILVFTLVEKTYWCKYTKICFMSLYGALTYATLETVLLRIHTNHQKIKKLEKMLENK